MSVDRSFAPYDVDDETTWPRTDKPDLDLADRIDSLQNTVAALELRQAAIERRIADFADMIQPYLDQISPMIEQLANSQLFRMMTGGKKKV